MGSAPPGSPADDHFDTPPSGSASASASGKRRATRLRRPRTRSALVALLLVGLAYATMIQSFSWNQTSHYDLIRSLNSGKTTIDQYQENTGDKVYYKGH